MSLSSCSLCLSQFLGLGAGYDPWAILNDLWVVVSTCHTSRSVLVQAEAFRRNLWLCRTNGQGCVLNWGHTKYKSINCLFRIQGGYEVTSSFNSSYFVCLRRVCVQWMFAVVPQCTQLYIDTLATTIDNFGIEVRLQVNQQSEQECCCNILKYSALFMK
jgi:hypothetical protein